MNRHTILGVSATLSAVCAAMILGAGAARADRINVRVNGDPVYFEGTQPRAMNGRVLVPLRGVLEKMGATVDWMPATQTVVAVKGNMEINLPIGSRTATINGRDVALEVPAMTIAGSTMVPLRFVSEALGANVGWESATQTVLIDTEGAARGLQSNRTPNNVQYDNRYNRNNTDNRAIRAYRGARTRSLPAGTVLPARLDDALTSNEARNGDRFSASIENGRDDAGLPAGTKVEGVIREAIPARGGKPGVLDMDFQRIILPNGETHAITASLISLDNKGISRSSDGRLEAKSGNNNNERLKWVGIGAGAGLLISTLTKGNTLLDTLLGGGAGYLYNELQRKGAGNVNLKAGTELGVNLNRSLAYTADRNNSDLNR